MKVKICGITNFTDAQFVVDQHVDFLGFIFHPPSPNYIAPQNCEVLVSHLKQHIKSTIKEGTSIPTYSTVGVFLNHPFSECQKILAHCSLDYAQLHGNESIAYALSLGVKIIKTFHISPEQSLTILPILKNQLQRWQKKIPNILFLLDTYKKELQGAGGTGTFFNWNIAKELAKDFPIMLSGGLHPNNISEAIVTVQPFGIDVKTGVEEKNHRKDYTKIKQLLAAIKNTL